ncbi:MAG: PQQ-binding-like beta-propeller repeat protein, partial [Acidimicrobiales bacterium]
LSPEQNRLNAYDPATGAKQTVVEAVDGDGGMGAVGVDDQTLRRDINGQVCADPSAPRRFIAGEDTFQDRPDVLPGWGYFELTGDRVGALRATQLGKLVPDTYLGVPENYGCGFLPGGQLVTTAVGDQLPGEPLNGQLILWFPPFDRFDQRIPHCNLDTTLGTAGGVHVDGNTIYVAANRSGVLRYTFPHGVPASEAECGAKPAERQPFGQLLGPVGPLLPLGQMLPFTATPSAIVASGRGTFYVSSVFTGTVAEYRVDGTFLRYVLAPPLGLPIGQITGITPFGMAVAPGGTLYVADLGIVGVGPADEEGSVLRVRFDGGGRPLPPETIDNSLTFPDGLGVMTLADGGGRSGPSGSEWPCGHWGMYGRTLTRTFATDCPSGITPETVVTLVPAWTFRPPLDLTEQATFTASPAVVEGVVYIGGWDGVMYAIDAATGALRWAHRTDPAPGAAFGPIVSSAAVADVRRDGMRQRLVIFGAGPRLYALDGFTGARAWTLEAGDGAPDDPAEIESSPVVWEDTVYVGVDVHNQPDRGRGGLLAVDVRSGELRWKFEPEAAAGAAGAFGCGGVWGSPTIDAGTGTVFFGTANCPAVTPSNGLPMEALYALDARTGAPRWRFGPEDDGSDEDEDFGATPNLFVDRAGTTVVGAGRKDGT